MLVLHTFLISLMQENLNLPPCNLSIQIRDNNEYVFDIVRKKYVRLTPEERVRQTFVHFLVNEKSCPVSLMSTETQMKLFNTIKRSDIIIYDKNSNPLAIVECKAPDVKITQEVFTQIARYNINVKARFLIVTNGINHYCVKLNRINNKYEFLHEIPNYFEFFSE